jgi:hypothetical protein
VHYPFRSGAVVALSVTPPVGLIQVSPATCGPATNHLLAQLAQLGGGFANFAGNAPSQLNGLAAISGRFARVVATKAIPFCSWI